MVGERANADDEPELVDDDDEGAESTVAMVSPTFDPTSSGMPLPISEPPPPLPITPPEGVQASPFGPIPTAPVAFTPLGNGPAGMPQLGRQKAPSSPMVPTPIGGLAPSGLAGAASAVAAPAAAPPPASARVPGAPPRSGTRRPQTVIGLAPPPAGAPRPPAAPPRPPLPSGAAAAPPRPTAGPAPRPGPAAPSPSLPFANATAANAKDDGPTMMGSTDQSLALFGLDAGAADAARAAVALPGPRPPPPSARSSAAGPGLGGAVRPPSLPPPLPSSPSHSHGSVPGVPRLDLPDAIEREEEESTRAVSREELLRGQDAHVVVGDDAGGDDATLAVAPGDNEANSKHLAALAQTMAQDPDGAFPPPPGGFPPPPPPAFGLEPAPQPLGGLPPQPADFGLPPMSNMGPPGGMRPPMESMHGGMGGPHPGWNEPQPPPWNAPMSAPGPHMPGTNPHGHAPMPQGGQLPPYTGQMGQMGQMGQSQMPIQPMGPISYSGQMNPMMQGQAGGPWASPAPVKKGGKISGQVLLLAIVGVICLAIFITGLVLFATTKF